MSDNKFVNKYFFCVCVCYPSPSYFLNCNVFWGGKQRERRDLYGTKPKKIGSWSYYDWSYF